MNKKSTAFDKFLVDENIDCFDKKELNDEDKTVIYRSYVQTEIGDMPIFVLLDETIYSVMRVVVGSGVITESNRGAALNYLNKVNSAYKSFKYYIEPDDDTLYLDCIYMSGETNFEPRLLYVLMNQVVQYLPDAVKDWKDILGIEKLPDPYESHEQHHEHHEHHHDHN